MTAQFIGARVPICDANFVANPIWYRLWQRLFDISGVGSVDDSDAASVAPVSDQSVFLSIVTGGGADIAPVVPIYVTATADDLAPVDMTFTLLPDDVSPAYAGLSAQIAELRAQIDDLRKGLTS